MIQLQHVRDGTKPVEKVLHLLDTLACRRMELLLLLPFLEVFLSLLCSPQILQPHLLSGVHYFLLVYELISLLPHIHHSEHVIEDLHGTGLVEGREWKALLLR